MHLSEDELILHYYGEPLERDDATWHISACEECRSRLAVLQRVLNSMELTPVPERSDEYGQQVWSKLAPKVGVRRRWRSWFAPQRLVLTGAVTAAVVISFFAGRYSPRTDAPAPVAQTEVRERVLLVALTEHLERSQMVLVEIANAPDGERLNIAGERAMAETLVEANRLYRQTAQETGHTGAVLMLEDLERVLLEIAHSPDNLSKNDADELRRRIEDQNLLFKVRVFGSRIREPRRKEDPTSSPIL